MAYEPQYILVNGAMQLNPRWQAQQLRQKHGGGYGGLYSNDSRQDNEEFLKETNPVPTKYDSSTMNPYQSAAVTPEYQAHQELNDLRSAQGEYESFKTEEMKDLRAAQGEHDSFLQTKKIDAPDTVKAKSIGAVAGAGQEIAKQISGESVGSQTTSGVVSGAASGAAIGSYFMPGIGTAIGAGVGAVLGGYMSSKKAKKAEAARVKAEKERKEKEKRMRTERAYTAKMSADQAAYANLQQGIANALSKSNVKIRV